MQHSATAIIVTHNAVDVLPRCLHALSLQKNCSLEIVVVDSGSADTVYLKELKSGYDFTLIETGNIGYSKGNNRGYETAGSGKTIVFLNPDTFLPPDYIAHAIQRLDDYPRAAVISGVLEGFDLVKGQPSGRYDSTGIFRKIYGRWYDRDQGKPLVEVTRSASEVPAVCGALMVCRQEALKTYGDRVFDEDFFLYKEDIEFSIRLRKNGWKLLFDPALHAYHCRGWNQNRKTIARKTRLIAAENEVLLYKKHPSPYMLWALVKLALVRWGNL